MRKIPGIVLREPHLLKFVFDGIASWSVEDQRLRRRTNVRTECEKDIVSLFDEMHRQASIGLIKDNDQWCRNIRQGSGGVGICGNDGPRVVEITIAFGQLFDG